MQKTTNIVWQPVQTLVASRQALEVIRQALEANTQTHKASRQTFGAGKTPWTWRSGQQTDLGDRKTDL